MLYDMRVYNNCYRNQCTEVIISLIYTPLSLRENSVNSTAESCDIYYRIDEPVINGGRPDN